jgi:hypothetical protein
VPERLLALLGKASSQSVVKGEKVAIPADAGRLAHHGTSPSGRRD